MQVVSFGVAALYSGIWWLRWARGGGLERISGQLRVFCGMVCAGSVAGAVAWGAQMQSKFFYYGAFAPGATRQRYYTSYSSANRLFAVFVVLYGFEFLCLIIAKLTLLRLLADSTTQSSQADVTGMSGVRRRWVSAWALPNVNRVMAGAVVVGSVVGVVANAVAGAYFAQWAGLDDQAAAACDASGSDTAFSLAFFNASVSVHTKANTAISVQAGSEALSLLLVSFAYVVIVSLSAAHFRTVERHAARALLLSADSSNVQQAELNAARIVVDTMQAAAQHRRRLTAACVIVLVTFPARAAFDLLDAYAVFNAPENLACGICEPCQSEEWLIRLWIDYTPEFQAIVVAVSSPLPLTLSLWLMTKAEAQLRSIAVSLQQMSEGP